MSSLITCKLCEKEYVFLTNLCVKCRRVKHLLSIYNDDVYKCLEQVLVRNDKQQHYKLNKIKDNTTTDNSNDRNYKITKEIKEEDTKTLNTRCMKELKRKLDNIKEV